MKLDYTTKDITTIVIVAVVFGILGAGWGYIWNLAFTIPKVGGIFSAAISFIWFISAPLSFYLVRKPGVAIVTQLLAGVIAILAGHPAGVVVFGWYVLEGLGAELGLALFRYRRWNLLALSLAGFLEAVSYGWGLVYFQTYEFGFSAWFWPWVCTFATAWIAGPVALAMGRALGRTNLYALPEEGAHS